MRFYNLDGIEEDVQEPKFHLDEELLKEQMEYIEEMFTWYV